MFPVLFTGIKPQIIFIDVQTIIKITNKTYQNISFFIDQPASHKFFANLVPISIIIL